MRWIVIAETNFLVDDLGLGNDLIEALLKNGFEKISCTEMNYYDEFGRELSMPYYVSATCYEKRYWWGTATVSESDIMFEDDPVTVYLKVNDFPPRIVRRILDGSADSRELDNAEAELLDVAIDYERADVFLSHYFIPVDHNLTLSCKRNDLINCIENVSSWISDYIEYLKRRAEELLRKYKPDELEEYRCPRCGFLIKNYEREYHLADHEMEDAKEQLNVIKRIISEEYRIPSRSEYPLAFKYFEKEIMETIKNKILPLYRGVADEINRKIKEKGLENLGVHKLHYLEDIVDLLKNIPREIRWLVVNEYTNIPHILSSSAYQVFMKAIENDATIKELMRKPNFSIKINMKKGRFYLYMFNNNKQIAYLKIDERLRDKIWRKVAEYLEDPEEIKMVTDELYRKTLQTLQQLKM